MQSWRSASRLETPTGSELATADHGVLRERIPQLYGLLDISDQQDISQFNPITDFVGQLLHREGVALFGAVLPATTLYNCVHVNLHKEPALLMPAASFL